MHPQPLFKIFGLGVYPYGLFIGIGILACLLVFFYYTKRKNMPEKVQDFTFFVAIGAIVLGFLFAKLYQAFYDWIETGKFNFYSAGFTAMGGFIGGAITFLAIYFGVGYFVFNGDEKSLHLKEFNKTLGVAPICITIAHAFGRLGCLMAGCCHGAKVGEEYVFGTVKRYSYLASSDKLIFKGYYVPVQLYEALFLFALFGVLTYLYFNRCNIVMSIYLISYGVWRLIIEFFRTDARGAIVLGLAPSQWQSFVFIAGGIAIIVFYLIRKIPLFFSKEKK